MAEGPATQLRIDVLGAPVVTVAGAPLRVDTRKAVAVLGVLTVALSEGRADVPRAELAALLWPDADADRARGALRRTLSVLVAATGATDTAVVSERSSVGLRRECVTSDVVAFRSAVRALAVSPEPDDLARAVGLVRGEFMAGFALRDAPPFDEWVSQQSDALRRELGAVLERLVVMRLRRGELHAGLADAARWLELDPLHEAAHRSVMRLLAWTGRRQDALTHYGRCVRLLGDELGVAPVRATVEVYEAIRAGTLPPPRRPAGVVAAGPRASDVVRPAPDPVRPAIAPSGPIPLVGRATELATLRDALGRPGQLVVISGEGGVGRSRLVEEFLAPLGGRALLVHAHDGEALSIAPIADLIRAALGLGTTLPDDLAAEVSRLVPEAALPGSRGAGRGASGDLPAPLGERDRFYDAVLRTVAASRPSVVVIEDVQAIGASGAQVLAYLIHRLDRLPCPLVLTWRDPGLPPRHPVRVAVAAGRNAERTSIIELARLTHDEVLELAAAIGTDGATAADVVDGEAVWRDTAGLPLLVVGAVRAGDGAFPMTVRELLAARLAEVSEETGQVLGALAVLDGVAAPEDLHGTSGRTEDETVDAVEEAIRAGLVREEGGGLAFTHDALRRVAYDQLSLVRRRRLHQRAAETLAVRPDRDRRAEAVAAHLHLAGRTEDAAAWARRAAQHARDLFAHEEALHQLEFVSSLGHDDAAVAFARGEVLVTLGRYGPAASALHRALALTEPAAERAAIERLIADVAARQGDWSLAMAGLDAAVDLAAHDDDLRARLLADRAVVGVRAGRRTPWADAEAAIGTATSDAAAAYVRNAAGVVALAAGDVPDAVESFEAALRLVRTAPDQVLEAAVINNLARAESAAGRPDDAVATARAALELGVRLGDRHRLAALHANLADRLHEVGDTDRALVHLTESAALFAELDADPLARPDVWTLTSW